MDNETIDVTIDDTIVYLDQLVGIDSEITSLDRQMRRVWHKLMRSPGDGSLTSVLSGDRVQTSKSSGWNEDNIQEYLNLKKQRTLFITIRDTITNQINSIDSGKYRVLLRERYVLYLTWDQIAKDLDYSEFHCRRDLHDKALEMFREKYRENIWEFIQDKS